MIGVAPEKFHSPTDHLWWQVWVTEWVRSWCFICFKLCFVLAPCGLMGYLGITET